jgi:hypothetical protein
MKYPILLLVVAGVLSVPGAADQGADTGAADVLTAVRITDPVLANGKPLPPALYQLRLTNQRRAPLPGQSAEAERWVEFVADGTVVAREVAVVLRDDDLPEIGASSVRGRDGTRVERLQGGEFVRISVRRGSERYLVYLPVAPGTT